MFNVVDNFISEETAGDIRAFTLNNLVTDSPKYSGGYISIDLVEEWEPYHDLQKEIHEDMRDNFEKYPSKKIWGNTTTDKNIDHRRTQNLECFLTRAGAKLPITNNPKDYKPGDLIFWADIATGHVGIVVNQYTEQDIPKVVHNIGNGPKCEDFLFKNRIIGHYRWFKNQE